MTNKYVTFFAHLVLNSSSYFFICLTGGFHVWPLHPPLGVEQFLRSLLSGANYKRNRHTCCHLRKDGQTIPKPQSLKEKLHPRKVVRDDHYATCGICDDRFTGAMYACSHCPNIAHCKCIEKNNNDIPQDGDEWMCNECISAHGEMPMKTIATNAMKPSI